MPEILNRSSLIYANSAHDDQPDPPDSEPERYLAATDQDDGDAGPQSKFRTGIEAVSLNYADALQLLPQFEPYSYATRTTVHELEDVDGPVTSFRPPVVAGSRRNAGKPETALSEPYRRQPGSVRSSHAAELSNLLRTPYPIDVKSRLLRGLQDIMCSRDLMLAAQLKVEDTERQLAETRSSIGAEIRRLTNMSRDQKMPDALIRKELDEVGIMLELLLKRLEVDETALVTHQRGITLQQGSLKFAINALYGEFTNGALIGESELDIEDEILINSGLSEFFAAEYSSVADDSYEKRNVRTSTNNANTKFSHLKKSKLLNVANRRHVKGTVVPEVVIDQQEVVFCGVQLANEFAELESAIEAAAAQPLLRFAKSVSNVRRKDLQSVLSIDPNFLGFNENAKSSWRSGTQHHKDDNTARKTYDSIDTWGSTMSQNALTELIKTALHHCSHRYWDRSQICLYDLVDVEQWGHDPLSVHSIMITDILRRLDLSTTAITISRRVQAPESLRVNFTGMNAFLTWKSVN